MKARPAQYPGEVILELNRRDEPLIEQATLKANRPVIDVKQILVPIDFSSASRKAIGYAARFARSNQATIQLLYVLAPFAMGPSISGEGLDSLEASRTASHRDLELLVQEEIQDGIPTHCHVRVGSPVGEILDMAQNLPADLIVLSTHGRTGLKHVFLGSVAEHIVQRAPCPVLVVR